MLSLLNGVLDCRPHLTDLTIKNPYSLPTYLKSKTSILDVKAQDEHGVWYDIEMQIGEHGFYGKRALYYLAKMYVDQLKEGVSYEVLQTTIGIHLLDFDYFPDERYYRRFIWKDADTNEAIEHLSYQQLYFIEMRKFRKEWEELSSLLDRWIAFMNRSADLENQQVPPALATEPAIVKAFTQLDRMYFEEQEREIYEAELKARRDDIEEMRTAREKGRLEGRAEGREEGRADVLRLLEEGMSAEEIRRTLGK